ncbi:hypothetical protein D918_01542 [Trichuris suis]|nr:hypothetical protein D918_01542 [Trichuris suis]
MSDYGSTHEDGAGEEEEPRRSPEHNRRRRSASRSQSRSRSRSREERRRRRSRSGSRRRSRSRSSSRGYRVHIGDIDSSLTERDLNDAFKKFGKLNEVWMATYAPYFAFVVFNNRNDAEDAVRYMNGSYVGDCKLRVSMALPRRRANRYFDRRYPPRFNNYRRGGYGFGGGGGGYYGNFYDRGGGGGGGYYDRRYDSRNRYLFILDDCSGNSNDKLTAPAVIGWPNGRSPQQRRECIVQE